MPGIKKQIPFTLLVGTYASKTFLEISLEVHQKLELLYDHTLYLKDVSEACMKKCKSTLKGEP
jgi:hypothetical protein